MSETNRWSRSRTLLLSIAGVLIVVAGAWGVTQLDLQRLWSNGVGIEARADSERLVATFDVTSTVLSGNGHRVVDAEAGGYATLRSTGTNRQSNGRTSGAVIVLPTEIEQAVAGRQIKVVVRARSSAVDGSESLYVAYSTDAVGNSGWEVLTFGPEFGEQSFTYSVPGGSDPGVDYLGLSTGFDEEALGVDIATISIYLTD